MPRTFQGRLTVAFVAVIALTLLLVLVIVLNRLDDYFASQQAADLDARSDSISAFVRLQADGASGADPVVGLDGSLNPNVSLAMHGSGFQHLIADLIGQADVTLEFGQWHDQGGTPVFVPATNGRIVMPNQTNPATGQSSTDLTVGPTPYSGGGIFQPYVVQISLSDPYTYRA